MTGGLRCRWMVAPRRLAGALERALNGWLTPTRSIRDLPMGHMLPFCWVAQPHRGGASVVRRSSLCTPFSAVSRGFVNALGVPSVLYRSATVCSVPDVHQAGRRGSPQGHSIFASSRAEVTRRPARPPSPKQATKSTIIHRTHGRVLPAEAPARADTIASTWSHGFAADIETDYLHTSRRFQP